MNTDILKYSVQNLKQRRMRSWLTVLSILIGIMGIFAIISFGEGVKKYTNEIFEEMGTDKLMVQVKGFAPPGTSSIKLTESDVRTLQNMKDIDVVTGMIIRLTEVRIEKDKVGKWPYVMGMSSDPDEQKLMEETWNIELEQGRWLKSGDRYKAVLGYNYQLHDKVFEKPLGLRDKIYIKGVPFRIVGFYEEIGNPGDDSNVYIPLETANEIFEIEEEYDFIMARVEPGRDATLVAEKATEKVRKNRGLKKGNEDFYIQTFEEVLETFGNILAVLNGILVLIALISVVVSAVNIANTMYTAVVERTREIGIMKAIGAKNNEIMMVFLIESGLLGLGGGAIGIFLGYIVAKAGGFYADAAGYSSLMPYFPVWLIIGCLLFSFFVGMLSGVFPAYQASKQKPVEALRYE